MSSSTVFREGERVLCYEPDSTKVRVVYDAKILSIAKNKTTGQVEYNVHFQGWSATWDRFVGKEYLLKNRPENRELQAKLFADAKQIRKEAKKNKKSKARKDAATSATKTQSATPSSATSSSGTALVSHEDPEVTLSACIPDDAKLRDGSSRHSSASAASSSSSRQHSAKSPSAAESFSESEDINISSAAAIAAASALDEPHLWTQLAKSAEGEAASTLVYPVIKFNDTLKQHLETDWERVMEHQKLTTLPAEPNVVQILERYLVAYGTHKLNAHEAKFGGKIIFNNPRKEKEDGQENFTKVLDSIEMCKEVLEGVRVLVDFYLESYLLYDEELIQCETFLKSHADVSKTTGLPKKREVEKASSDDQDWNVPKKVSRLSLAALKKQGRNSTSPASGTGTPNISCLGAAGGSGSDGVIVLGPPPPSSKSSTTSGRSTPTFNNRYAAPETHPQLYFENVILFY